MKKLYSFNKNLYSKEALFKAAYQFIDDYYIHLDENETEYIVEMESKNRDKNVIFEDFKNEMLLQETRKIVAERTQKIREIIYARAMASTIIDEKPSFDDVEDTNIDEILLNWFEAFDE